MSVPLEPALPAAAKKAKFPGAKTYKDKAGNIREVGTGKLIRAVAKAAPKATVPAKTKNTKFTDGQGVVRKIGSGIAVNPLDQQVDAAILQTTAPLTSLIGKAGAQYGQEQGALSGANTALNSQLSTLQDHIAGLGAQQLGAAATAAGGTAEQQTANLSYLKNLLGGAMTDGGSGLGGNVQALAAAAQGEGAGANAGIALGSRGQQSDLATMGAANAMQTNTNIADRMLARNAAIKDYNDKIAAAKANRFGVKNDLINQSLDQQAARQEIALSKASFDREGQQYKDAQAQQGFENGLALSTAEQAAAAQAAKATGAAPKKGVYGFGEAKDAGIKEVLQAVATGVAKGAVKTPWRTLQQQLSSVGGLSADQAALLATKTYQGSITSSNPENIWIMLKNRKVSPAVQSWIIKRYFGDTAWANLNKKGGKKPTSSHGSATVTQGQDGMVVPAP